MFKRLFASVSPIAGIAVFLLAACSGTSSTTRKDDASSSSTSKASANAIVRPENAPNGDVRVMFYQPPGKLRDKTEHGDLAMVLVNENHSFRANDQGRFLLALKDPNRAYNVMTEEQATALLESLKNYGFSEGATPFTPGDENLLTPAAANERYRGVIVVERAGERSKVVGLRPSGQNDVAGQRRYKQFVDMKGAIALWARSTASELPIGGTNPVRLDSDR